MKDQNVVNNATKRMWTFTLSMAHGFVMSVARKMTQI